jgi:hypothetical protein
MYTLRTAYNDQIEEAKTNNNVRKIQLYEGQLKHVNDKIPAAEKALKDFYQVYQTQKAELLAIKDEIAAYKATGMLAESLSVTSDYDKRASTIKDLTNSLKMQAKRAQSILEVNSFEDTFTVR